jgi:hypothetical protein
MARGDLLVTEARRLGLDLDQEEKDQMRIDARNTLVSAANQMRLRGVTPRDGETVEDAIDRRVKELLRNILTGETDVIPLGAVAFSLRKNYDAAVHEQSLKRVVERVAAERPAVQPGQRPGMLPTIPGPAPNAPRPNQP